MVNSNESKFVGWWETKPRLIVNSRKYPGDKYSDYYKDIFVCHNWVKWVNGDWRGEIKAFFQIEMEDILHSYADDNNTVERQKANDAGRKK